MAHYMTDSSDSDDLDEHFSALSVSASHPRHGTRSEVVHTKTHLKNLYLKAVKYLDSKLCQMRICNDLYRDKSTEYFNDIINLKQSVMEPYRKDCHGDPKSPINDRIDGLFFTANVLRRTGQPPDTSIYGERRFRISPDRIMDITQNAYFTDFYCVFKGRHYITLVLTSPGSRSDRFCKKHLIPFDMNDNPFFCITFSSYGLAKQFKITDGVWVEILVTEKINVTEEVRMGVASWTNVVMTGQRSGGNAGLVKNLSCPDCNL